MPLVLIIDDDMPVRKVLVRALKQDGYESAEAVDGDTGIEMYDQLNPDVVVTDILMPGKYGLQVVRHIRDTGKGTPVIVISGYHPARLSMAEELGAVQTLQKPFEMKVFLNAVSAAASLAE